MLFCLLGTSVAPVCTASIIGAPKKDVNEVNIEKVGPLRQRGSLWSISNFRRISLRL